jgi:hypothetical protein
MLKKLPFKIDRKFKQAVEMMLDHLIKIRKYRGKSDLEKKFRKSVSNLQPKFKRAAIHCFSFYGEMPRCLTGPVWR